MKVIAAIAGGIVLLFGAIMAAATLLGYYDAEALAAWVEGIAASPRGWWLAAAAIAGLLTVDLVLPIPSIGLMLVAGKVLGPVAGAMVASAGAMAAGFIGYWGCRIKGRRFFDRVVDPREAERMQAWLREYGPIALIVSRFFPMLPEILACVGGLSRMPAGLFFSGFALGTVPFALVCGFAGANTTWENPWPALAVAVAVPAAGWWIGSRFLKREGVSLRELLRRRRDDNDGNSSARAQSAQPIPSAQSAQPARRDEARGDIALASAAAPAAAEPAKARANF